MADGLAYGTRLWSIHSKELKKVIAMKKRLRKSIAIGLLVSSSFIVLPQAEAKAVYCTNCTREFKEMLRHATDITEFVSQTKTMLEQLGIDTDSLAELFIQTEEALKQTAELVIQSEEAIKQTEMQIKNLEQLGDDIKNRPLEVLMRLAKKTNEMKTHREEANVLIQVFNELYPEQSEFADLANAGQEEIDAVNQIYQEHYDKWSEAINDATEATFQVSGDQLKELGDDGELRAYIASLLQKPDANLTALQAANDLAAIQLDESRKLRALIATQAQETAINRMKTEKLNEEAEEAARVIWKTDDLDKGDDRDRPLPLYTN